jgi:CRISPR-associated protein Cmr1
MRRRADTPPEITIQPATVIRQERKYQLITPLYGGGVTPAEPDPITVVRATEIRGHLRFWWRACRGGRYGTLEAIKRAEDDLWGTAGTKQGGGLSQVQVEVAEYSVSDPHASLNIAPPYAVFPLR